MKTKISYERWKEAQEYERKFWNKVTEIDSLWYLRHSKKMKDELKEFVLLNDSSNILQIGCGPEDVIHSWGNGNLFAVDPQIDNYKEMGLLKESNVKNICAVGENLPFKTNYFDLIIINNVLDHCQNPKKVLQESNRCLKKNGILYTATNVRPMYLYPFLKIIWWMKISTSKGHPYLFLPKYLCNMIKSCKFKILLNKSNKQKFMLHYFISLRSIVQYVLEYE
ncbi:MAG: class I SAM-dependent methyltransferase, partial [Candidatus Humimicrobiaceae bacterium]